MADDGVKIVGKASAHADAETAKRLRALAPGEGVELDVDGVKGVFSPNPLRPRLPIYPPGAKTPEEREMALNEILELRKKGWRSEGPYGPRDELYDRD